MHRSHVRIACMFLGLLTSGAVALGGQGFSGAYQLDQWATNGIPDGTTAIDSGSSLALSYDVDLSAAGVGVSFRTAEFSVVAPISGTFTVDWEYSGFHSFFLADAVLQLFAETSSGRVVVDLVPQGTPAGGGFTFGGQGASIEIEAGMPFGIIVGGSNLDSASRLMGTVRCSNLQISASGFHDGFDPANWTDTGIAEGTTSLTPAAGPSATLDYTYDVNLGNSDSGVPQRSATISVVVPADGQISFDWSYDGFHAFCCPSTADLVLTIDHGGTLTTVPLVGPGQPVGGNFQFSGSVSGVRVWAGDTLLLTVGGQNFDSNSRLTGTVSLSNFVLSNDDFTGTLAPAMWSTTGIAEGTTDIGSVIDAPAGTGVFSYDVDLSDIGAGVPPSFAAFNAIAEADGTVSFDWDYRGFHAFFLADAGLQLFADTRNGRVTVDLVPPGTPAGGGFVFRGQNASIQVEAGMPFGIIVGGSNYDSASVLRGTVILRNFCAPIAGDLDGDGDVDLTDLSTMLGTFGACDGDAGFLPAADIDHSGCVDIGDLSVLLTNFGL